jgi:RNA polymerase sigma factor (sigma-70 family)
MECSNNLNDNELLARFVQLGDETAFSSLIERHLRPVFQSAMRRLGDLENSEDVALRVFTILGRKAESLCAHPALGAWLQQTTIFESAKAARHCEAHRRKMMAYEDHLTHTESGDSVWADAALWLDSALLTLTHADCQILQLHYVEGRSYREVGDTLGLTEGASRVRAKRALTKLSQWFDSRGFRLGQKTLTGQLKRGASPSSSPLSTMKDTGTNKQRFELKGTHTETIRRMISNAPPFLPKASPDQLVAEFANGKNRMPAFLALCALGKQVLPAVRQGFEDPDWNVRRWCAVVADNFADAETLRALIPLLNDPKSPVRVFAVHALACEQCKDGTNPINAVPMLLERIFTDDSIKLRRQAVAMLAHHR